MTENELSDASRALLQKARHAYEIGNFGYVIQLMQQVLKEAPGFLDGRRLVRKAAFALTKGKKSMLSGMSTLSFSGGSALKKDPLAAIELAEKTLATDPGNVQANKLLCEAANKAGFPETGAFALETLVVINPRDTKLLHELGHQYVQMGASDKAVAIYNKIAELNPSDLEAIKKGKDSAAFATMKKGGWEEVEKSGGTKNFRDLLTNKDQTTALENKGKVVRTAEQITQQISDFYTAWEADQNGIDNSRRLASLYEQLFEVLHQAGNEEEADQNLSSAVWFYSHTNTLTRGADPGIARKVTDLGLKQTERRIHSLETWLATPGVDPAHPDVQPYVQELQEKKAQIANAQIDNARKRVTENPTDLFLRFELGEAMMKAGLFTEAIPELQRAKLNPNVHLKAMNLLGQCFVEKRMFDLAVSQFKAAASEISAMDNVKKDILYRLGLVYEEMGNKPDYIACMKEIYEADYSYKDVAKRVESSYEG